ncbi:MAG TPA: 1-acyl-sn-glycerol-3-phosphate acyltransferase [bacterium]
MSGGADARTGLPRLLTWAVEVAVTLVLWGYFILGFVFFFAPLCLLAMALGHNRARAAQRLNNLFYRGFFRLCRLLMPRQRWEIDPALTAVSGSVVVCNHLSYLDPLLFISLFPRHTTVVKERLFRYPFLGWVLRASGYLASGGPDSERTLEHLEGMRTFLAGGGNLFVFPEGTRSRDGSVGPLQAGAFKIARLCRAPVAVAAIGNTQRLFTPGRFRFAACRPNTITVRLLARLTPAYDRPNFSTRALIAQVRALLEPAAGGATAQG